MKTKRKKSRLQAGALIIITATVYIILSTRPSAAPSELEPLAEISFPAVSAETAADMQGSGNARGNTGNPILHYYINPESYGYYTDTGTFPYMMDRQESIANGGFALDDGRLLQADSMNHCIWFSNIKDKRSVRIPVEGIPSIIGSRMFILRNDQMAAGEIDSNGKLLWSREFGSILTASSVAGKVSLWGFLDGSVEILDEKGALALRLESNSFDVHSEYRGVYGAAIAVDGDSLALLYGLGPQYMLVYEKKNGSYHLVHSRKLEEEKRYSQPLLYSLDGESLLAASGDGLVYYDRKKKKSSLVAVRRALFASADSRCKLVCVGDGQFGGIVSAGGESFMLMIRNGLCTTMMPAADASDIVYRDGELVLTMKGGINRFEVVGRVLNQ
ncbi:MAG: hypothetical protein LLF89_01800 [Spirochaetaceae bacterium]|nr:hypothetical protein [Spirochaetaceae bacterium]